MILLALDSSEKPARAWPGTLALMRSPPLSCLSLPAPLPLTLQAPDNEMQADEGAMVYFDARCIALLKAKEEANIRAWELILAMAVDCSNNNVTSNAFVEGVTHLACLMRSQPTLADPFPGAPPCTSAPPCNLVHNQVATTVPIAPTQPYTLPADPPSPLMKEEEKNFAFEKVGYIPSLSEFNTDTLEAKCLEFDMASNINHKLSGIKCESNMFKEEVSEDTLINNACGPLGYEPTAIKYEMGGPM